MLVLSRKNGEKIHIGDDIVIEVRRISGSRVSIAVQAPTAQRILRGELREAATAFEAADEDESSGDAPCVVVPSRIPIPSSTSHVIH
ncbi:MAG: carbon storage regulator [Planctomycetales bacterium]|nr:carbon storage regulator [Planctomycetales bacterium]